MKLRRAAALLVVPFLFSCLAKRTEPPWHEVPAGPLVTALEQQRAAFTGFRALASMDIVKRGRKRSFDLVGIVTDGRRLRLEAFDPLGQSLLAFVWDGSDVLLRLPGSDRVMHPGKAGLDQLFGEGLEVRELCALFAGLAADRLEQNRARLFCSHTDECVLETADGETRRRIGVRLTPGTGKDVRILSQELRRDDETLYRARFTWPAGQDRQRMPEHITIESPSHKLVLDLVYTDMEMASALPDDLFRLEDLRP